MSDNPLRDLYGDAVPTTALAVRVKRSLRQSGTLASRVTSWRFAAVAGVILAAIGTGYMAGRARPQYPSLSGTYVLLLYEDSSYHDERPTREIVAEYARWADSLAESGALVLAEKLGDDRRDVIAERSGAERIESGPAPTGIFIVRARDAITATAIARDSPHARQGGRVVVMPIETSAGSN